MNTCLTNPLPLPQEEGEAPPQGLHSLNYARRICEDIGMPLEGNLKVVASAIEAVMVKDKCDGPAAMEFLLSKVKEAEARSEKVDRWWFQDSKWKPVPSKVAPKRVPVYALDILRQQEAEGPPPLGSSALWEHKRKKEAL